jgi:hypothetical protein
MIALVHAGRGVADGLRIARGTSGSHPPASRTARSAPGTGPRLMPMACRRATPSGFMMKEPMPMLGRCRRAACPGTSAPVQELAVPVLVLACSAPRACRPCPRWRGCRGCGGWPARRNRSSGTRPGRSGLPVAAACGQVARLAPATGVDPVAAGGAAVVAQYREARDLLAGLQDRHRRRVPGADGIGLLRVEVAGGSIRSDSALPEISRSSSVADGSLRLGVVPGEVQDGVGAACHPPWRTSGAVS